MKSLEVLIATMNQSDDSLLEKMNISSDVIVCNQNESITNYKKYNYKGSQVRWYNFQEKGVGLNRNNALFRATSDICLLADDDVVFCENYEQIILDAFDKIPDADIILFNIDENGGEKRYVCSKVERIRKMRCGRFGAVRVAFRRKAVIKHAISFSLLFGGGAPFSAGEDTMFLEDCLKNKLKIYAVPEKILRLNNDRPSTWFCGYDRKFFVDMGASYYVHYGVLAEFFSIIQLLRHRNFLSDVKFFEALKCIRKGIKQYRDLR